MSRQGCDIRGVFIHVSKRAAMVKRTWSRQPDELGVLISQSGCRVGDGDWRGGRDVDKERFVGKHRVGYLLALRALEMP